MGDLDAVLSLKNGSGTGGEASKFWKVARGMSVITGKDGKVREAMA